MARVQIQYVEAIKNKKIGSTERKIDLSMAKSRDGLVALWDEVESEMENTIGDMSDEERKSMKINWEHWHIDSMGLADHIQALSDHTNLHNGQLIVYLRAHDIKFPDSWKSWGL
jgi:uncharacterized damage-inducible protein DinB